MHTDPQYKLKLSEAAPLSSWWGSSWRTRCIRGSSKTMKNHNMFSNELDVELHPTPWHVSCWGTTWTESAVHSLVHLKIGSNPAELRQLVTEANCVGVERRSRAPRHRDELRDDWEPQGNSSIDVYKTWQTRQQMATAVCFWHDSCAGWVQVAGFRDHNLRGAFWMEYFFRPSSNHNLETKRRPPNHGRPHAK